jgi:hypothetical protein
MKAMIVVESHFSGTKREHFYKIVKRKKDTLKKTIHRKNIELLVTA